MLGKRMCCDEYGTVENHFDIILCNECYQHNKEEIKKGINNE